MTEPEQKMVRVWRCHDCGHRPCACDEPAAAPVGLTEVRINIAGDALMTAWAIIANAWEGDWSQAPDEWRAAAERWRDEDFHPLLDALQEDDHD